MEKENYIKVCKEILKEPAQSKIIEQVENFYKLKNLKLDNEKYSTGDQVILKKDTFLHGFGNSLSLLELYAKEGLISKDFELGQTEKKISYAVSLWHIHKKIKLADYVKQYSGMTFSWNKDKFKIVPYGELDKFIESIRNENYFSIKAETTMEARFLPSLQKDGKLPKKDDPNRLDGCRQIAFILNGRDKNCQQLVKNNLLDESLPLNVVFEFMHLKNLSHIEMFKKNRRIGEDERIAYILFGIPTNMIEGVFVGRIFENNKKILAKIKELLPNCYICNVDGKVIVGNKWG